MTFFTSAYKLLAHLAPNWDTQLRTDMAFLETNLDQAAWSIGWGGGSGATVGSGGGSDGYAARVGNQKTYNGRVLFGSSAVSGGGVLSGFNGLGSNLSMTHSLGYGLYSPPTGSPSALILLPTSTSDFTVLLASNGAAFSTLTANPPQSSVLRFVVNGIVDGF
jgi:hypothetical protein